MNHGFEDEDEDDAYNAPPPPQAGPSGILAHLMGGMGGFGGGGGHNMFGGYGMHAPPSSYDDYFKAYSAAVMGGNERPEVMYGGSIIMPPSALAKLSGLDIEGPWTFHLRNPKNPNEHHTYAGVLEFIASEGVVHLPAWMMKTLHLNEGDPIRLTGTVMPTKGKLVKVQAQSRDFEQVSDPRAVLEAALRSYSVLTKGSIIEITYNSLTFEFLIVDVQPTTDPHGGISVLNTDLEVDFDVPVGYVEPPRPEPKAVPTMAEKLKIDLGGTTPASAGSSRPASSLGGAAEGTIESRSGGSGTEVFTGVGQSLSGKRVKGRGLAKKIEEVDPSSKINRNERPRIITPSSLADDPSRTVPAVLSLPPGKFFFGYTYVPFDPSKAPKPKATAEEEVAEAAQAKRAFGGEGVTLKGKRKAADESPSPSGGAKEEKVEAEDPWAKFGSGNTLKKSAKEREKEKEVAKPAAQPEVIDATMDDDDDFWEVDDGDDDGEDFIEVDSD